MAHVEDKENMIMIQSYSQIIWSIKAKNHLNKVKKFDSPEMIYALNDTIRIWASKAVWLKIYNIVYSKYNIPLK